MSLLNDKQTVREHSSPIRFAPMFRNELVYIQQLVVVVLLCVASDFIDKV